MFHLNYSNQFQYVVWKIVILLYIKAIVFSVSLHILDICSPSSDIKSLSGSIRSPGLPKSLSGNLACRWNLSFPVGYNMLVEFSWFGMSGKGSQRWYKTYNSYWPFWYFRLNITLERQSFITFSNKEKWIENTKVQQSFWINFQELVIWWNTFAIVLWIFSKMRMVIPKNVTYGYEISLCNNFFVNAAADLGEGPGSPAIPLFWVKKEEMTEGRKAGWASKIKPVPLPSSKSRSATEMSLWEGFAFLKLS